MPHHSHRQSRDRKGRFKKGHASKYHPHKKGEVKRRRVYAGKHTYAGDLKQSRKDVDKHLFG